MIRGVHLAQVVDIHPESYEVSVYLPYLPPALLGSGLRVRLGGRWQQPKAGEFAMPRIGDWGVVAFFAEDPRAGIWLTSIPDRGWHIIPQELLREDPKAVMVHYPGGQWTVQHGDGSTEMVWPDGSHFQAIRKPEPRGWLGRLVERFHTRRQGKAWVQPMREPYTPPDGPKVYLYLQHASGTQVHLAPDGSVRVRTPSGQVLTLDEGEFGQKGSASLQHPSGHVLEMTPAGVRLHSASTLTLTASGTVVINGSSIAIG